MSIPRDGKPPWSSGSEASPVPEANSFMVLDRAGLEPTRIKYPIV